MAFWKPGGKKPEGSTLPLSAEVDRDAAGEGGRLVTYNRNETLALAAQRQRLPIFKCRDAILYLVETRATTAGEGGGVHASIIFVHSLDLMGGWIQLRCTRGGLYGLDTRGFLYGLDTRGGHLLVVRGSKQTS